MKRIFFFRHKWTISRWAWVALITSVIIIKWVSLHPVWVENNYTYGIYPIISRIQRALFGWSAISVGDLFYCLFIWIGLAKLYRLVRAIYQKKIAQLFLLKRIRQLVFVILFIYVGFNLLWGLNYNRIGISKQLGLEMEKYNQEQLATLITVLENRLNKYVHLADAVQRDSFYKKHNLFRESFIAYKSVAGTYPFLSYKQRSIKSSLFSYVGNIFGFQGYYNPFSGEAQVNTTVPNFTQPFIACHEIGHQLGYGKENEANFAGFLACRAHPSAAFKYSVYLNMYQYALQELKQRDTAMAKIYYERLSPLVKQDFEVLYKFFAKYENPIEPVITWFYSHYLKVNNQPLGKETYNQVVTFLIAYQKKFGIDAL